MATIGSGMNGNEENGADSLDKARNLETIETLDSFHERLGNIEDCCKLILGYLPNLEHQRVEIDKQWVAVREIRGFCAGLHDTLKNLTDEVQRLNARLSKRHPGAEP